MSPSRRADPPRLDPGHRVVGEDAPLWVPAAAVLVGVVLAGAALWALRSDGTRSGPVAVAAQPAARPTLPALSTLPAPPTTRSPSTTVAPDTAPAVATTAAVTATVPVTTATPAPACPSPVAIWFPAGSATPQLDPTALTPLAGWVLAHPGTGLVVRGHASAVGDDQGNLLLSYQRALAVRSVLVGLGVPESTLLVRAAGALEPVTADPADATNQRAVVEAAPGDCAAS
ncbi:MAG: OmpA family protein [Acidimicrobiales bacterium]